MTCTEPCTKHLRMKVFNLVVIKFIRSLSKRERISWSNKDNHMNAHLQRNKLAFLIFIMGILSALYVGRYVEKTWLEQSYLFNTYKTASGKHAYVYKGEEITITTLIPYKDSPLISSTYTTLKMHRRSNSSGLSKKTATLCNLSPHFILAFGRYSLR